jgi:hypothetical protein
LKLLLVYPDMVEFRCFGVLVLVRTVVEPRSRIDVGCRGVVMGGRREKGEEVKKRERRNGGKKKKSEREEEVSDRLLYWSIYKII